MKTLVIIILLVAVVLTVGIGYGAWRWDMETRTMRSRLDAARRPVQPPTVDFGELEGLPPPVQRYFRAALIPGAPMVAALRARHIDTFNMGETQDEWKPFTSDQLVVTRRPGFDWDARVALAPGLEVRVHDAYVDGEGILRAAVAGLVPVASLRGTGAVAEGELMRFLAEAAWYPTALLPSQGVRWEPVDASSARATLENAGNSVALLFAFTEAGMIESVRAEARGRTIGGKIVPTPWLGRFWNYQMRYGMLVPTEGEVAWILPQGPKPYWRGRVTGLVYEFSG